MGCRIACFIDGGYMDKLLQEEFNSAKINYGKLAEWMTDGIDLWRAYYYNCLPYKSSSPTPEENERYSKAERFYNILEKLPRFEVRKGKLEFRGKRDDGKPMYVQKRVDILLALDLINLCIKNTITHAAILTGDSDYLPVFQFAKDQGVLIYLCHSNRQRPHQDLWTISDERKVITADTIQNILRNR